MNGGWNDAPPPLTEWQVKCPTCGCTAECERVDIGVGEIQSGPYVCLECGWVEEPPDGLETPDLEDRDDLVF